MKVLLTTVLVILVGLVARASDAQKERGLYERATAQPDMALINPLQDKVFNPSGGPVLKTASNLERCSGLDRGFATGEARISRSFFGIKNPWFGRKVFGVPERKREKKETFDAGAAAFTDRDFTTGAYADNTKKAPGEPSYPTRAAAVEGAAQGSVSELAPNAKKKLTLEDVREILNKND